MKIFFSILLSFKKPHGRAETDAAFCKTAQGLSLCVFVKKACFLVMPVVSNGFKN